MEGVRKFFRSLASRVRRLIIIVFLGTFLLTLSLRWIPPPTTSFMIQSSVAAFLGGQKDYQFRYGWVDWDKISPNVAIAVIAAEDQKFPQHVGFDLESITDAWQAYRRGGRLRGASTISQQVAKNLFLWPRQSFFRKGVEAYFTVLIELLWPKRRIIEVYLNLAEFGRGVFGIAAASETFFGRLPAELQPKEAALLAAVLPNPRLLRVDRPSAYVLERRAWILRQMKQLGGVALLCAL